MQRRRFPAHAGRFSIASDRGARDGIASFPTHAVRAGHNDSACRPNTLWLASGLHAGARTKREFGPWLVLDRKVGTQCQDKYQGELLHHCGRIGIRATAETDMGYMLR